MVGFSGCGYLFQGGEWWRRSCSVCRLDSAHLQYSWNACVCPMPSPQPFTMRQCPLLPFCIVSQSSALPEFLLELSFLQDILKLISCRINSIDKSRLSADSYSYSGNGIAWKARVILFVGFALMAGGLAGAVTVLVLKYLVHDYPFPTLGFGVSNVVANALVMLR